MSLNCRTQRTLLPKLTLLSVLFLTQSLTWFTHGQKPRAIQRLLPLPVPPNQTNPKSGGFFYPKNFSQLATLPLYLCLLSNNYYNSLRVGPLASNTSGTIFLKHELDRELLLGRLLELPVGDG